MTLLAKIAEELCYGHTRDRVALYYSNPLGDRL